MPTTNTPLTGKVILITGATNGIGRVTARALATLGATVVIVGRDAARTQATLEEIKAQSGNLSVDSLLADLSSMAEVRRLAEAFKGRYGRLDVLVNNAGAIFVRRQNTVDGYEMTFALNHLSYFLLTNLLLDLLKASAPSRIVNVASDAHEGAKLDLDNLNGGRFFTVQAYGRSKLANILFTYELARRLEGTGVTANALHPGFVATGFGANNGALTRIFMRLSHLFALTPAQGADTVIYLASSPDVEGISGRYFVRRQAVPSSPASYDEATARRLWEISAQMTGLVANA